MSTRPTDLPEDGEELLRALLLGERDPDEPEVRARLAAEPELRARWEAERELTGRLDAAGDLEDEVLAELDEGGAAPGEERVEATLAGLARGRRRSVAPWRPFALLAAAALLAALGWYLRPVAEEAPDAGGSGGPWLGVDDGLPQLVAPTGAAAPEALETFRWSYSPPPGAEVSCRVLIIVGGVPLHIGDTTVYEGDPTGAWEWTPSEAQRATLIEAGRFDWQVEAADIVGEPVVSAPVSVSVSP